MNGQPERPVETIQLGNNVPHYTVAITVRRGQETTLLPKHLTAKLAEPAKSSWAFDYPRRMKMTLLQRPGFHTAGGSVYRRKIPLSWRATSAQAGDADASRTSCINA